jgi:hypothetical protein
VIVVNSPVAPTADAAPVELSPGMQLTLGGASFGATPGQAGMKVGELVLAVEVVQWQPSQVVVRLPNAQIARAVSAELVVTRSDATVARAVPFELVPAGTN